MKCMLQTNVEISILLSAPSINIPTLTRDSRKAGAEYLHPSE